MQSKTRARSSVQKEGIGRAGSEEALADAADGGVVTEDGGLVLEACGEAGGIGSEARRRSRQSMNERNGAPQGAPTELRTHGHRQLIDPSVLRRATNSIKLKYLVNYYSK